MAKVTVCDCCGSTRGPQRVVMDADGIHTPTVGLRQDGFREQAGPDLCESCRVSLAFKWGELKTQKGVARA
jgi:hypothetical protein